MTIFDTIIAVVVVALWLYALDDKTGLLTGDRDT